MHHPLCNGSDLTLTYQWGNGSGYPGADLPNSRVVVDVDGLDLQAFLDSTNTANFALTTDPTSVKTKLLDIAGIDEMYHSQIQIGLYQPNPGGTPFAPTFSETVPEGTFWYDMTDAPTASLLPVVLSGPDENGDYSVAVAVWLCEKSSGPGLPPCQVQPTATLTPTPTATFTPTFTPTATPSQTECVFASPGVPTNYYLAPITNNPIIGSFSTTYNSSFYQYIADRMFTDRLAAKWYRIIAVVDKDDPLEQNVEDEIGEDGVWVNATILGLDLDCDLPIATEYAIPEVPWDTFEFTNWSVSVRNDMCSADALQSIHALGINPQGSLNYPKGTHNGSDLFVHDPSNPTEADWVIVSSMGDGIVVGMHGTGFNTDHSVWGGAETNAPTPPFGDAGYAVIVRYGHLYVLYAHLAFIEDYIYVGAPLAAGQQIGIQGKFNSRHAHIEVHSYGAQVKSFIDWTGILPVNESASEQIPHFVYELAQLLPEIDGYYPANNVDSTGEVEYTYTERLATVNLEAFSTYYGADLNLAFDSQNTDLIDCTIDYRTQIDATHAVVSETTDGYRGFDSYENVDPPPSPFDLPSNIPTK